MSQKSSSLDDFEESCRTLLCQSCVFRNSPRKFERE